MSGMAILLLVTLQADDSGWRSTLADLEPPSAAAPAPGRGGSWQDPSGQVQDAVNTVKEYAQAVQSDPNMGSALADMQRALEAAESGTTISPPANTVQDRMRNANAGSTGPPPPPGRTTFDPAYSNAPPVDSGSMMGRFDPQRAAAASAAPPPTRSPGVALGFPETGLPRNNAVAPPQGPRFGAPNDTSGREVVYEQQLSNNPAAGQRYISPPPRTETRPVDQSSMINSLPAATQTAPPMTLPLAPPASTEANHQATAAATPAARPWGPLLMTVLGLFGSLGFNLYLGWIAWDLYSRYQDAVDDVQELETKLEAKQQELAANVRHVPRTPTMVAG